MSAYIKPTFLAILLATASAPFAMGQVKPVSVTIDFSKSYQTIDNFGASDAWSCQFTGNWPDAKRNKLADLLFTQDTLADGSPKGIALSLWRFNIGGGSTEQGAQSGIKDEWRRAGSFLDSNNTYNWNRQAGQLWFLKAAKERGVAQFLGFCNSPPYPFTINKKTYATGGQTNIAPGQYLAFAGYLADVVNGVEKKTGVRLNYISPVNEPQWDWSDGGQEGCPYTNLEIAGLLKAMNTRFAALKTPAKLIFAEAGSINYLHTMGDKPGKGNQINDFFNPASANYIGNLAHSAGKIAAHSYFTTSPIASSTRMRHALADSVAKIPGLSFWQSEYCILGDNAGEINGSKRDFGMDAALYLAKVIHTDLTAANATAWQWWTAISAYDYKDGLIYIDKNKNDGNIYTSKMLWALGNYSRFIRPGAVRIATAVGEQSAASVPVMVSAFKNGNKFTMVMINPGSEAVRVKLDLVSDSVVLTRRYTTSDSSELLAEPLNGKENIVPLKARSITTIIGLMQ